MSEPRVKDLLLTTAEFTALISASVAFDGEHMDTLTEDTAYGAEKRRERLALNRALAKARGWRR